MQCIRVDRNGWTNVGDSGVCEGKGNEGYSVKEFYWVTITFTTTLAYCQFQT